MTRREATKPARRRPIQARSRAKVEFLLEAAARVFRREGTSATTNRIAAEAGVGIGTLYEYFPDKHALLLALAERHVELAERGVAVAVRDARSTRDLVARLSAAILESHRFPSQAVALVAAESARGSELAQRASELRRVVLSALEERASGLDEPALRARAAFGALGELAARSMYEIDDDAERAAYCGHLVAMASAYLER